MDDEPNARDYDENHAEIIGILLNPETLEEKKQVEDYAQELAEFSSLHYDRYNKYA